MRLNSSGGRWKPGVWGRSWEGFFVVGAWALCSMTRKCLDFGVTLISEAKVR